MLGRVYAHVDVGDLPAVRGIDVVGTRGRGADEIVRRPQEHVVTGSRPRLVRGQEAIGVGGVEEEVEGGPALPLGDPVRIEDAVEVVGAVDVPRVAHVLVVLRVAGELERVVPSDRVAHHLDERVHVGVVELPEEAGRGIRGPGDGAGHRRVEAAFDSVLELAPVEGEEVGALLALDVDDLDVLAGANLVREGCRLVDAEVEPRLGERGRKLELAVLPRRAAADLDEQVGRGRVAVDDAAGGSGNDDLHLPLGAERLRGPGRGSALEEADSQRFIGAEPRRRKLLQEPVPVADELAQHRRGRIGARAERAGIVRAFGRENRDLRDLAPVGVDDGQALVRLERDDGGAARAHEVGLEERILGEQPTGGARSHQAFWAGAFASCSEASAINVSASSRLPSASSFLISFSTARRLYVWFQ